MIIFYLALVAVCCVGIWKVSDYFEEATDHLGRNMSNGVKGASLNAIGSSMPELVTSFIFLFFLTGSEGYAGTIGTTAGSAVFNTLLIPAAVIIVVFIAGKVKGGGIELDSKVVKRDGAFLILSELALILVISSNTITLIDGIVLLMLYLAYSIILYRQSDNGVTVKHKANKGETRTAIWYLVSSVIAMTLICWVLVYSVEQIGILLNVPLIFVSVLLASAASSVPDTIISIRDGLKGNYDDAVSNALGSNIFDICIAHGLPLFIYIAIYGPITMSAETTKYSMEIRIALIIVTVIATIIYFTQKKFKQLQAYMLIALYIAFTMYAVLRATAIN